MIIKTKRLILRPWQITDAENLYEYAKDSRVGPIAGWLPHHDITESRKECRKSVVLPGIARRRTWKFR